MKLGKRSLVSILLALAVSPWGIAQGKVIVYTSMKASLMDELQQGFRKQNPGMEFEYFASGAGKVMARLASEQNAGKQTADVLWHSEIPDFLKLKAEGRLEQYRSPEVAHIRSTFMDDDYYWTPARLGTLGVAYNTKKIKQVPRNWTDLQGRSFRRKFAVADPSLSGTSFMSSLMLVNKFGWVYFETLHSNKAKIGQGSVQVVEGTAAGNFKACIAVDYIVLDQIRNGANLGFSYPPEMLVIPSPVAILKKSNNLAGAKKFVDFLLSREGQTIIANAGTLPVRSDVSLSKEIIKLGVGSIDEAIKRALPLEYADSAQVRGRFLKKFEATMRADKSSPFESNDFRK